MNSERLISWLSGLGDELRNTSAVHAAGEDNYPFPIPVLVGAIEKSYHHNPWFIPQFVRFAFDAWAQALTEEKVVKWLNTYNIEKKISKEPRHVGIVMAGNIPMVGLHDMVCVLASGNHAVIKLSQSDDQLVPALLEVLYALYPEIKNRITLLTGPLKSFDAVIATGSNNTSRYFEYYFGKYPNIIRRNRNSVAILTGHETGDDLERLADDIFLYFGLGCRNVSKIFIPSGYKIENLLPFFEKYSYFSNMHKYRNNYDYQKSMLLINRINHYDSGFLLLREDASLISPISVVHTETYTSLEALCQYLEAISVQIQCLVSQSDQIKNAVLPGQSQFPELWDYADGIDTMDFLMNL
jgi:hypothetical protein